MHPISSTEKRRDGTHEGLAWSESVVRRRRAMTRTESESDTEAPPPPPFPPECLVTSLNCHRAEKKCSNCSCQRSDISLRKSSKSYSPIREKVEKKTSNVTLQQLETKLYSAELEDAMHYEKMERVEKRLKRAAQLLEALLLFTQSLDLQVRAAARVTQLMGNFAYKDLNPTGTLVQTLDRVTQDVTVFERLSEIQSSLSRANEIPEYLDQLTDEFKEKRKNYIKMTSSFSQYLRSGCQAPNNQLHKFERQWDSIRSDYDHSRKLLEREYSKLIDERHDVLEFCFSKLAPIQENLLDQDNKFSVLSKEVSKGLREQQKYSREKNASQSQNSKVH